MPTDDLDHIDLRDGAVPETDSFALRLMAIRHAKGWTNVALAARECEVSEAKWRRWEAGTLPRDYIAVCRKIADATGYSMLWIAHGEAIRSRCFTLVPMPTGQMELPLGFEAAGRTALSLVSVN